LISNQRRNNYRSFGSPNSLIDATEV